MNEINFRKLELDVYHILDKYFKDAKDVAGNDYGLYLYAVAANNEIHSDRKFR